jgi:hypothetical protein
MDTPRELFDSEIVWHFPGHSVLAGDHRGPDAVPATLSRTSTPRGSGNARSAWSGRSEATPTAWADRSCTGPDLVLDRGWGDLARVGQVEHVGPQHRAGHDRAQRPVAGRQGRGAEGLVTDAAPSRDACQRGG